MYAATGSAVAVAVLHAAVARLNDQEADGCPQVTLRRAWLTSSGTYDVLHLRYLHPAHSEQLEYRVEMDLAVRPAPGTDEFEGHVVAEAADIVAEVRAGLDERLLAQASREGGVLCWGAVLPPSAATVDVTATRATGAA